MTSILFVLFFLSCWTTEAAGKTPQSKPPNILLVTVDTLRAEHLSCYGYAWQTSPHIDKLAAEGVRFENAYTVIPLTGPAHLSLFTSRYPQEHGARRNGEAIAADRPIAMLPQVLRANGYRNAAFVSAWPLVSHLTHLDRYFDTFDERLNRSHQLFSSSRWAEDVTPPAIEWLKSNSGREKPFFLWVHYFDPHAPYHYREHFARLKRIPDGKQVHAAGDAMRERIRNYDTEIAYMDWHFGKLLSTLDQLGLRDSTLVVLTADHGESLGEHGYVGHGRQLFEDITRIPLIVRLPGVIEAGLTIPTPVSILDIAPTLLGLTVRDSLEENNAPLNFSGRTLAPGLAAGKRLSDRAQYSVTYAGKKGYAPKWLSWLWMDNAEIPLLFGYLTGNRKLIYSPNDETLALYDIGRDPAEVHPQMIGEGSQEYVKESERLKTWLARTDTRTEQQELSARDVEVLKSLGYVQ